MASDPSADATEPSSGDASDRVYAELLARISEGQFAAGERLYEQALAQDLGVSRTPVRDALKRLAAEGLVDTTPNKGAQVVSFTAEDTVALYDLRAQFEPVACRLAVPRLSEDDLAELEDLDARMQAIVAGGQDPAELTRLNNRFHAIFVERCGNRHLSIALQALFRPAVVTRTFRQYSPRSLERSMQAHQQLVEAARAGDGEWAESVMRSHILSTRHATGHQGDAEDVETLTE
ncbi:GntR family transcriptional regulator [Ornithinimicrobium sp. F0845]|uniref:GntR family transcriptional regulator n=1 Tax=Ornithinimicrobium sp. F0845 TaxID=2926412 RepID=UPI001FF3C675|nr:GntR family transcriptional regulator [Ornithinimicrobium sp. F0845]MCK0112679.1 GntR family transcriptional regulator [Ornithinimicrobium sp. F0845]